MAKRKKKDKEEIFDEALNKSSDEENVRILEKDYLDKVKEKNKKSLIQLDIIERERIARYIKNLYLKEKTNHNNLCDEIDDWDDTYRMKRKSMSGDDGDLPNYVTPLSTVTLEVVHANIMNVFFTPKDTMRIIPTEQGDIPKIKKLDTFGNWSMKNEMNLFENCDRLFHSSNKNGSCPYMVHWVKEYGTEIIVEPIMNPMNPTEPLIDSTTKEPLIQEREEPKLLYNGPKFEIFSRKDYIIPINTISGEKPDWEMRRIRYNADEVNRNTAEGKFYPEVYDEIGGWTEDATTNQENRALDKDGSEIPMGRTEKLFLQFFGTLRIKQIKEDKSGEEEYKELEDEFIGIIEINSETLCSLKKNKFPLKMRPTGLDEFIPDDEGRAGGIGVFEMMDSIQKSYDALHNQYLFGTVQANSPFGFFTPTGNTRDEPIKAKAGYLYPTSDPQSVNIVKIPPPDSSLQAMLEMVRYWGQLLFGIGDYQAGIESTIDPSAPAKKAEIVVAQGNVRLNLIIKRKNRTLQDIFKRWFLLYQANMPPNKFMRIAGEDRDNPWKFERINLSDFALNSIPDFELTGNVLNANKTLEIQKKLGVYNTLIANPFFNPATAQGQQSLHALTKWLLDGLDETGISNFLPSVSKTPSITPEEENARMLQGDAIEPIEGEDYPYHIKIHGQALLNPVLPESVRQTMIVHIGKTAGMMQKAMTQRIAMAQLPPQMQPQTGGQYGQNPATGTPGANISNVPAGGIQGLQGRNPAGIQ